MGGPSLISSARDTNSAVPAFIAWTHAFKTWGEFFLVDCKPGKPRRVQFMFTRCRSQNISGKTPSRRGLLHSMANLSSNVNTLRKIGILYFSKTNLGNSFRFISVGVSFFILLDTTPVRQDANDLPVVVAAVVAAWSSTWGTSASGVPGFRNWCFLRRSARITWAKTPQPRSASDDVSRTYDKGWTF